MNCHQRRRPTFAVRGLVSSDLFRCSELSRDMLPSELRSMMQKRTVSGRILEIDAKHTVSFIVYSKHKWLVEILDFGFEKEFQEDAAELVLELQSRMVKGWGSVKELVYCVPETELATHLLLRSLGFVGKIMPGDPPLYRFGWRA